MPNIDLQPVREYSAFRRLALGSWRTAYDPTIYGAMEVRMEKSLAYIEAFRQRTGIRLTVTHLVAKALAQGLRQCPEANGVLRFNRIYLRRDVDLSILVVQTDEGASKVDLAAAKIKNVDQKSLLTLAREIEGQVSRVRKRQDPAMEQGKKSTALIPLFLMSWALDLLSFLMYTLNLDLSWAGIPRDLFGGATVTNVGSLGIETAYVPLVPYTRVPIFVAPGAVCDAAVVENGQVVPGKVLRLHATFDHRLVDGFHTMVLAKTIRAWLEDPFRYFDDLERLPEAGVEGGG
ncbi:MAG: 2-oxo acid dehydrogenase subunit E2 [Myxococcota bacterium]